MRRGRGGGPALFLLGEPLDSLDLPNQAAVAALISDISRDQGVTVMLVAHDVNPILPYIDRVVYVAGCAGAPPPRLHGPPIEVLTASDGGLVIVGHPEAPARNGDRHSQHD